MVWFYLWHHPLSAGQVNDHVFAPRFDLHLYWCHFVLPGVVKYVQEEKKNKCLVTELILEFISTTALVVF